MNDFDKIRTGLFLGDRLALSKAITLIETEAPEKFEFRNQLLREVEGTSNPGFRLAVTGVPGAGKSTLIDRLGMEWIGRGHKVAVLAIDPTSSLSQGSILGDKTRMNELARHPNAFIRPSPTRLQLGGVASTTFETILLCEAAGFDRIIVETVGVGQSETLVSTLTDACLLLLVTGTGDELQGVKKGILETADVLLVNKADGSNEEKARAFERELKQISGLWPLRRTGKPAEVLRSSSLLPEGLVPVLEALDSYLEIVNQNGELLRNRFSQKAVWLKALVHKRLEEQLNLNPVWKAAMESGERAVLNGAPVSCELEQILKALGES
jgi:LAO/AO transport system kinase